MLTLRNNGIPWVCHCFSGSVSWSRSWSVVQQFWNVIGKTIRKSPNLSWSSKAHSVVTLRSNILWVIRCPDNFYYRFHLIETSRKSLHHQRMVQTAKLEHSMEFVYLLWSGLLFHIQFHSAQLGLILIILRHSRMKQTVFGHNSFLMELSPWIVSFS